ncbi:sulfatase [Botrimarina sp.]|uniref:sulfatase n=1 Tax=Botrimarina sp. TaxID=2795802 RepID=UPI0032ED6197
MALRVALVFGLLAAASARAERPSVVILLADDLGWRDLSATGSTFYQTPHIDRVFSEGARFENGYASCQVCSPTRASLMTGKTPARHGITNWIGAPAGDSHRRNTVCISADYRRELPAADVTLAEALRDAGYRTFFAGKWHLGGEGSLPTDHGFQINKGGHHKGSPPGGYFAPYKNPKLADGPAGEHLPARLAEETAGFIRDAAGGPFLAVLSFYSVHGPLQTTRARWDANRREALAGPRPSHRFHFDRRMPMRIVQDHPVYAGMVEAMDDAVGRVLAALEENHLSENTIVVFASDNGGVVAGDGRATSNLPLRGGKGWQWEGGFRTPLAIRFPSRIPGGTTVDAPAITCDFYPTVLDLCGLPPRPEQHTDGLSLVPAMRGGELPARPLFWHYPHYGNQGGEPSSVVRDGGWKLIRYHEDGRQELYHLAADPGEQTDLAQSEPERLAGLARLLDDWLAETHAVLPGKNPNYDAAAAAKDLELLRTTGMQRDEQQAAAMLEEDWRPNPTWWGSEPAD